MICRLTNVRGDRFYRGGSRKYDQLFLYKEWGNQNEKDSIYAVNESGSNHVCQPVYGKAKEGNLQV